MPRFFRNPPRMTTITSDKKSTPVKEKEICVFWREKKL